MRSRTDFSGTSITRLLEKKEDSWRSQQHVRRHLLGDTAVAVNPDDDRYKDIVGKMLKLPLTDREIPVIADEYVDKEFGTGCVKITPAHDPNDFEVGKTPQP